MKSVVQGTVPGEFAHIGGSREEDHNIYQTMLETASQAGIGIAVVQNDGNRKGVFKFVNDRIADLLGYAKDELIEADMMKIIHPESRAEVWRLYIQNQPGESPRPPFQCFSITKKGEKTPVEISTGVTRLNGKKALVCYALDISEKINMEERLKNAKLNLEKRVEERTLALKQALQDLKNTQSHLVQTEKMASIGQLAAGVAHEINNPVGYVKSNLGAIEAYRGDLMMLLDQYRRLESLLVQADILSRNPCLLEPYNTLQRMKKEIDLDYIYADYQTVIAESVEGMERVARIVADLKDFAHMDKAKLEFSDINRGIQSTLNIVWNEIKYKAEVVKEFGDIPLVKCYPQRLNQVFMNLLINAVHAIQDKGEIHIQTLAQNGCVQIRVRDTGCGMPQDALPKIFDPFYTTKAVGKGTGLGLNVAYNIIEKHGGSITVESEVGKGTTFTILLKIDPQLQ